MYGDRIGDFADLSKADVFSLGLACASNHAHQDLPSTDPSQPRVRRGSLRTGHEPKVFAKQWSHRLRLSDKQWQVCVTLSLASVDMEWVLMCVGWNQE